LVTTWSRRCMCGPESSSESTPLFFARRDRWRSTLAPDRAGEVRRLGKCGGIRYVRAIVMPDPTGSIKKPVRFGLSAWRGCYRGRAESNYNAKNPTVIYRLIGASGHSRQGRNMSRLVPASCQRLGLWVCATVHRCVTNGDAPEIIHFAAEWLAKASGCKPLPRRRDSASARRAAPSPIIMVK